MEPWRDCLVNGWLPEMSSAEIRAGLAALESGDPRLIRGRTAANDHVAEGAEYSPGLPCHRACLVGLAGMDALGLATLEQVHEHFRQRTVAADRRLGGAAQAVPFLRWFDEEEDFGAVRREAGAVLRAELAARREKAG